MNLRRFLRFLIGLVVAVILLTIILPHVGVPTSRYLPPTLVYQKATGIVTGQVTNKDDQPSNNPFRIGDRIYFIYYTFSAPKVDQKIDLPQVPVQPANDKPKKKQYIKKPKLEYMDYTGEIRVEKAAFDAYKVGDGISVRYEKTYPWVNGVDPVNGGMGVGVGEGSNILSGWLVWAGVAIVLGALIAAAISYFSEKEDL